MQQTQDNCGVSEKGVDILARSLFRKLCDQGLTQSQIISISSRLIDHVRDDMQRDDLACAE